MTYFLAWQKVQVCYCSRYVGSSIVDVGMVTIVIRVYKEVKHECIHFTMLSQQSGNTICHRIKTTVANICHHNCHITIWLLHLQNQNYKNIIKINILQTPSKVGVLQSKTFSHTPDEAMLG